MFFMIRFIFYFTLSFFILCIPMGDNINLFEKLHSYLTPYAEKAIKTTKQKLATTKKYSRKLYSNSEPEQKDEVKNQSAGIAKKKIKPEKDAPSESYSPEDQERLRKILNSHE